MLNKQRNIDKNVQVAIKHPSKCVPDDVLIMAVASGVSSGLKLSTGLWSLRPLVLTVIASVCWPCHREESPLVFTTGRQLISSGFVLCDVIINNLSEHVSMGAGSDQDSQAEGEALSEKGALSQFLDARRKPLLHN